jgi:hypothetical protein
VYYIAQSITPPLSWRMGIEQVDHAVAVRMDAKEVHMSIAGKSDQKLLEIAATMPPPMKQDITRAINAKK